MSKRGRWQNDKSRRKPTPLLRLPNAPRANDSLRGVMGGGAQRTLAQRQTRRRAARCPPPRAGAGTKPTGASNGLCRLAVAGDGASLNISFCAPADEISTLRVWCPPHARRTPLSIPNVTAPPMRASHPRCILRACLPTRRRSFRTELAPGKSICNTISILGSSGADPTVTLCRCVRRLRPCDEAAAHTQRSHHDQEPRVPHERPHERKWRAWGDRQFQADELSLGSALEL